MTCRLFMLTTVGLLAMLGIARGATLMVPDQVPTIQNAIDAAQKGDTVLVATGTYKENIDFIGKAIMVKSEQGASTTIIDGNQTGSVVACHSGEGSDSALIGFTITNGRSWEGGGMYIADLSSPTVTNCIFSENIADFTGGGGEPSAGGGMYLDSGSPTVVNCIFAGNLALSHLHNGAAGAGIYNDSGSPTVINCIFTGNVATSVAHGGGGAGGGMYNGWYGLSIPILKNCIFWNDKPEEICNIGSSYKANVTYSCVQGGYPGTGNIDSDPLFLDADIGDFHLTFNSPCRGSGDNTVVKEPTDFEGDPRIAYGTVDMGADEFYTHMYWTGDATPGGSVEAKLVGLPGTLPVDLFIGSGVLDTPIPSIWGDWYLQFPIIGPIVPGKIPSPDGVLVVPGIVPNTPPPPYSIFMQALIGKELTNLCVLLID